MDVGGLYDCLMGIFTSKAGLDILDKYSDIRREKYSTIVNPISSQNFERLWGQDPDKALENDQFLQLCHRASTDKELSVQLQLVSLQRPTLDYRRHHLTKHIGCGRDQARFYGVLQLTSFCT